MANLSNINNILRVSSSGVGINKNNTGPSELDIESAGADIIDMTRTGQKTYRFAISGASAFSLFDVAAGVDRLTIDSSGNSTFGGTVQATQFTATNGLNYLKRNTDASLQLRSENTRSGLFITKPATDTVMGSALVMADESYRFGTANYYHQVMLQDGNTYFNQNVGIGTTSPNIGTNTGTAILTLKNTGTNRAVLNMTSTTPGTGPYAQEAFYNGGVLKTLVQHVGDGSTDSGYIKWFTTASGGSTTERMRINSSGDVGIGTTPETAGPTWRTLFIGASAVIVSRQSAAGYDSIFANNYYVNSSNQDRVRVNAPSSRIFLDGNNIRFQISPTNSTAPSWSEIMRIDDTGNVGIRTTDPTNPLNINFSPNGIANITTGNNSTAWNTSSAIMLNGASNSNGLGFGVSGTANDRKSWIQSGHPQQQYANYLGTLAINPLGGNVGIGTDSPLAKLSVVGSGENGGIFFGNSGAQEHRFYASANSQFNTIGSSTPIWNWAQYTGVGVTPNYKMTLNSTGLGIGTTSPGAKLHINDTAKDKKTMIRGNSNSQGFAQNITLVNQYPVVSAGTQLIIPFTSQGNLNSNTIIKIMGHSARFNASAPSGFTATIALGHLNALYSLAVLDSTGNISGVSTSGMNLIISFTSAYTYAVSDGIFATIEYMTNATGYSLQPANIVMN